eukprot:232335_1
MNWIAPLIIVIAKENQEGVKKYCVPTFKDIAFINNFGWFDPLTLQHLNILVFGGFDLSFIHVLLGGNGCTSGHSLARCIKPKSDTLLNFNEFLVPSKDHRGCQVFLFVCLRVNMLIRVCLFE